jgi:hypothetical protein
LLVKRDDKLRNSQGRDLKLAVDSGHSAASHFAVTRGLGRRALPENAAA